MTEKGPSPRFILGLKIRRHRRQAGLTLSAVSKRTGLSISYLSEIEKAKKYPKPEKLVSLAEALGVTFDELVSLKVSDELSTLKSALGSPFLREFPFELFGFDTEDFVRLVSSDPARAGALIQAVLEVGQSYDVNVESFLLAALRAYQQMNANHFPELEEAAEAFRAESGLAPGRPVEARKLEELLEKRFGYRIDFDKLRQEPDLKAFRSVFRAGSPPTLFVNGDLMPSQRAFVLARELGYALLGLKERALTSSWLRVESFDQVLNNFKVSYFSGALLLDRLTVQRDMAKLFDRKRWDSNALAAAMKRFEATPETYFTRLTQLLPAHFGLREMYFLRMSTFADGTTRPTKHLNLSSLDLPVGIGLGESYCRRWPAFRLLAAKQEGEGAAILAQRSHFLQAELDFFVVSAMRRLALDGSRSSTVTVGWRLTAEAKDVLRFWDDSALSNSDVNLTCERCPLTPEQCTDRVADPIRVSRDADTARREAVVQTLLAGQN